ncbi:MAG: thioesterase family protein [Acidimicrobiia bacterium]|nr:thioesterase family protein [Acidimicrobiia bacterium]NNF62799.1 thioesterase family protein [Acidimicrobiia bacterium]
MTEALFTRIDANRFLASYLTEGPWQEGAMHGGAPAALVAHVVALAPSLAPMATSRITCEIVRPVPVKELTVEATVLREGKRIQVVDVTIRDATVAFVHARALRIRTSDIPEPTALTPPPAVPAAGTQGSFAGMVCAFTDEASEIRFVEGSFHTRGPGFAWHRLLVDTVDGEPMFPESRAIAAADFGNGISSLFDPQQVAFINPDLSLHSFRPPSGEWIGVASTTRHAGSGSGLTESSMYDVTGGFGIALQSLYLDERQQ